MCMLIDWILPYSTPSCSNSPVTRGNALSFVINDITENGIGSGIKKKPFAQAGDGVSELNAWKAQKECMESSHSQAGMFLLRITVRISWYSFVFPKDF